MKILENCKKLNNLLDKVRESGQKVGLIPTMGSIHDGHISLIKQSKKLNCYSIVSIFINPTQFNDKKDFEKYPQNRKKDIKKLSKIKCDAIYFPLNKEIYPSGLERNKTIFDYRNILCDKFRPGHFDGVTTVVLAIFNLVNPDFTFFGEKDFQQLKIINQLIKKYKLPIINQACPSIRLKNGMSLSSRYINFSLEQEKIFNNAALLLNKYVSNLYKKINLDSINKLKNELKKMNIKKIDYLEIRNENSLELTDDYKYARLFVAFYIDDIRVIDNFILY